MPFIPFFDDDGNPLPPGVEPPPPPADANALPAQGDLDGDIHDARTLDLQAAQQLQAIRDAATAQKGMLARHAADAAEGAIADVRDAIGSEAPTQRARDMFDDVLDRRADVLRQELKAHAEAQKLQAMLDLSNQRQAVAQQDAVAANTPLTFHSNVKTAFDEIDHRGELTGKSPEDVGAEKADVLSAIHASKIGQMVADGNLDAAAAHRDGAAAMLTPADKANVDQTISQWRKFGQQRPSVR